jgi:hypothetical protein
MKTWPTHAEIDEEVRWQLADWGVETYSAAGRLARHFQDSLPVVWAGVYEVTGSTLTLRNWSEGPVEPLTLEALRKTPAGQEGARMWAAIYQKGILVGALDLLLAGAPGPAALQWLTETAPRLSPIFGL